MILIECEQRTKEWNEARVGIPTASNFDKIITSKGEPSKQRTKYLYQLAGERVAGVAEDTYQNGAMLRGIEMEGEARGMYEIITDAEVAEVGFCMADGFGCSPDGLVGESGGVEIKCPNLATHVEYLLAQKLPTAYFQQVQGSLLVTGREWWDFVSYYAGVRPLIIRVNRDEKFLKSLSAELSVFCSELEDIVKKIS